MALFRRRSTAYSRLGPVGGRRSPRSAATWARRAIGSLALAGLAVVGLPLDGPGDLPAPVAEVAGAVATPPPSPSPSVAGPTGPARDTPDFLVADARRPAPPESLTGYAWPLPRGRLTLPFGPSPWGSRLVDGVLFHDGLDLATFCGDRIVAAHDGVVLAAGRHFDHWMGWRGDLGPYERRLERKRLWNTLPIVVIVDDGNGYRSIYAHFGRVVVKAGQRVRAGQLIGYEGATGRASGCHLHYGLFSPDERASVGIDPGVLERMKVPDRQIARIDPLRVLPERPDPTAKPTRAPPAPSIAPSR